MLCDTCVNAGTASYKYPCNCCDMIEGSSRCKYKKVRTHADCIRAMSDEELAKQISHTYICEQKYPECMKTGEDCVECLLEWLKQPAKGE